MNGIIIQQITLSEFELLIRKIVQEEFSTLKFTATDFKPPDLPDDLLLSKCEAAKLLRISLPTFSKMLKEGKIKPLIIGRRFKFKKSQILLSCNLK